MYLIMLLTNLVADVSFEISESIVFDVAETIVVGDKSAGWMGA